MTDAVQKLIDWGLTIFAVKLNKSDVRLDIGSPQTHWEALSLSHQHFAGEPPPLIDPIILEKSKNALLDPKPRTNFTTCSKRTGEYLLKRLIQIKLARADWVRLVGTLKTLVITSNPL